MSTPAANPRVTAALTAYRERLAEQDSPFADASENAEELAMAEAIKAADAVAFSRENIDLAAEALWDASAPVRAGARPRWALIKDDPEWHHGVTVTRNDAKTVAKTLWAVK
jgi:hypothetical protein